MFGCSLPCQGRGAGVRSCGRPCRYRLRAHCPSGGDYLLGRGRRRLVAGLITAPSAGFGRGWPAVGVFGLRSFLRCCPVAWVRGGVFGGVRVRPGVEVEES
jgi:hypothetical protein